MKGQDLVFTDRIKVRIIFAVKQAQSGSFQKLLFIVKTIHSNLRWLKISDQYDHYDIQEIP